MKSGEAVFVKLLITLLTFQHVLGQSFNNLLYRNGIQRTPGCIHDVPSPFSFQEEDPSDSMNCLQEVARTRNIKNPEHGKRVNEVILMHNYDFVTYDNVTTSDGYILTIFRIRGGPKSPSRNGKPAVLLFHGMGTAADQWILQYGDKNLAFKLANAGYEVWLANSRGTDFSQRHVRLNPKTDIDYWNFSFHEIGMYDFPAILNLMISETGNDKIFFVGHSMGANVLAIALSEMPELNDKIYASFLLAPGIFVGHSYSPYRILSPLMELGPQLLTFINRALRGHIDGTDPIRLGRAFPSPAQFCTSTAMRCGVCGIAIFFFYGYDAPQINFTNIPNILSKNSNTHSVKTVFHFGQNYRSCMFRKYDYGIRENLKIYGQPQPPSYNLGNIKAPVYIYYGDSDNFIPPVDAALLRDALPPQTVQGFFRVKWKLFNHADFMIAKDADVLVYNGVLEIMNKHTKQENFKI